MNRLKLTISLAFLANMALAQSNSSDSNILLYGIIAVVAVLIIWAMLALASNLMKIEAGKQGLDPEKENFGVFPGISDIFKAKRPSFAVGGSFHKLSKGHNIKLEGAASGHIETANVMRYAIKPTDFNGMSPIPKVTVEVGDEIQAGDVLFFDKKRPEIQYVSPVSGEIVDVKRGDKRSIAEIVILADKQNVSRKFDVPSLEDATRETLVSFMAARGLWPLINERPFDIVPHVDTVPVNIFISTFDSAPLAPDNGMILKGNEAAFQKGLDVLSKLTSGSVHLGLDASKEGAAAGYAACTGVEKHWFDGPHPAGNVGIQIHHVAPIKGSDKVWTLGVQEVISIGKMFMTGQYNAERVIALTGSELVAPKYVKTYQGASLADLLKNNIKEGGNQRIVSGDVLSGHQTSMDGFLRFKDDQITVLKEGNEYELFGWLLPLSPRPSVSGTIPSFGQDHLFEANTNTHGEKRAFVVTGQYESVLPMDIYPQHLMKAILTNDFEKMDGLGITELTEEDVALCEFVCTSKNPVQSILRQGLNTVQEQS